MIKVIFHGVRGSRACPGPEYLAFGGNTSCVEVATERVRVLFDAGTGLSRVVCRGDSRPIVLLLSHSHYDHLQGLPFFAPLFDPQGPAVEVYGPSGNRDGFKRLLSRFMDPRFLPFTIEAFVNPKLSLSTLRSCSTPTLLFSKKGVTLHSLHLPAHPRQGVFLFSLSSGGRKVVYASDIELDASMEERAQPFLQGADLAILDSHYRESDLKVGYGHSSFLRAYSLTRLAGVKRTFFFHFAPEMVDSLLEEERVKWLGRAEMAREGLEVEL